MPRDFLCLGQIGFLTVSRGEIFIEKLFPAKKSVPFAVDSYPGTGIKVCRNWDPCLLPEWARCVRLRANACPSRRVGLCREAAIHNNQGFSPGLCVARARPACPP